MAITSAANQGLEIGRRALQAQQAALNLTSNNVANANTQGYSRRRANMESVDGGPGGRVGNGVDVTLIERMRSRFLDAQARTENQVRGRWEELEHILGGLESIFNETVGAGSSEAGTVFNEPSGAGLSGSLNRFWNAWQDLANVPESGAARAAVRQEAEFMANTLHQSHQRLQESRVQLDNEVVGEVEVINGILDRLAGINAQIPRASFGRGGLADLEDQRDNLLDELSQKVDVALVEQDNGQVSVLMSGHNLVAGASAVHLVTRQVTSGGLSGTQVAFADDGSVAQIRSGRLSGLIEARDQLIPDLSRRLDEVAVGMVEQVNIIHRAGTGLTGSTGVNFFDPTQTTAANISVDEAIRADLNNIAASQDGNTGDNGVALAISGLRNKRFMAGGASTVEGFYGTLLGEVGSRSKEAQTMAGNHRLFSTQIENRRLSVQGVSLNDEAAQLVLFQRAYQAAARTVSVIDDLMETTINM
ncbi:MAG: flagellar hook-associated protein FlgK [Candidatus Handelsmanbacteria bacterium]|nr:flagellar hook-associated protein FlgK [Candidatus Handelsmanbacteria bacterium]